jgi:hypothetical protein
MPFCCCKISLWDFMLLSCYEICMWGFMLFEPYEMSWDFRMSFHNFEIVMRFPCETLCCSLHSFVTRFPYEILRVLQCNFHIWRSILSKFYVSGAQFSCKIWLVDSTLFWNVMRRLLYAMCAFWPLWSVMRSSYETSCFFCRYEISLC